MKKILFIFMSVALLTACSKDDDSSNDDKKILGTWFVVEANNIPGFTLDDCSSNSKITFMADNTADSEFYSMNEGQCTAQSNSSGWTGSGDNTKYTFSVPGVGPLTGTLKFDSDTRFTFVPDLVADSNGSLVFEK